MMERRAEDTGDKANDDRGGGNRECWSGFWPPKLLVTSNCFMCRGFYFEIVF